jgi:signal transduction histidine kinase
VKLVQEDQGKVQAGFLMYVPVYVKGKEHITPEQGWAALRGFVYSPFRMDDLMNGLMSMRSTTINFRIYDGDAQSDNALMYTSVEDRDNTQRPPMFSASRHIGLYGHSWTVSLYSSSSFERAYKSRLGNAVLVLGSIISLLLFVLISMQVTRRDLAERLAMSMTADLRKQQDALTESEARFRYLLETCPTAARISRIDSREILFYNPRYLLLTGTNEQTVQQLDPATYYSSPNLYSDIVQRLNRGEQVLDQLVELHKPGDADYGTRWALASFLIIQYAGSPAVLGWFHEITERIRIDKLKSEFIATVSHELRTPLTAIRGSLALLGGGVMGELSEKVRPMIDIALKNSERLILLVNDILDMEKIESGLMDYKISRVQLAPLLQESLKTIEAYAAQYNVTCELASELPDVAVKADSDRLMQVLVNLLSNAAKFSYAGGRVELSVAVAGGRVRIKVKDQGCGIQESFRERIFQKFSQGDSSDTRAKGGTGLGLAITKTIVEQMGGSIGFESQLNVGTTFFVELPIFQE